MYRINRAIEKIASRGNRFIDNSVVNRVVYLVRKSKSANKQFAKGARSQTEKTMKQIQAIAKKRGNNTSKLLSHMNANIKNSWWDEFNRGKGDIPEKMLKSIGKHTHKVPAKAVKLSHGSVELIPGHKDTLVKGILRRYDLKPGNAKFLKKMDR